MVIPLPFNSGMAISLARLKEFYWVNNINKGWREYHFCSLTLHTHEKGWAIVFILGPLSFRFIKRLGLC